MTAKTVNTVPANSDVGQDFSVYAYIGGGLGGLVFIIGAVGLCFCVLMRTLTMTKTTMKRTKRKLLIKMNIIIMMYKYQHIQ